MNARAPILLALALVLAPNLRAWAAGAHPHAALHAAKGDEGAWARALQETEAWIEAGSYDRATQRLEALLAGADPLRASEIHLKLAVLESRRRRYESAIAHGQDAIRAWPDNGWNYLQVARILVAAGRPEAAIALCGEAADRDSGVRFAAQDLIEQIQTGSLTPEATAAVSTPVPPPPSPFPWVLGGAGGTILTIAGGWILIRKRRRRIEPEAPRAAIAPPAMRVAQTGPVAYGPVGVRIMDPGEVLGHYRVIRLVNSSLHSLLYCAEDLKLGRQVAMKQVGVAGIAPDAVLSRFQKEVQSLISLSNHHDGVVKVFDFLEPGTLITEWIEGVNLEEAAQLSLEAILEAGIALCDVLAFAHAHGIVHRDIKPSNIMRTTLTGRYKLLDFGIAKNTALGTSNLTLDATVPIGTFTYMPPEQFAAPNQATPQADLYALGLTLYRLATGGMPTEPWLGPRTFGFISAEQFRPVSEDAPPVRTFLARGGALPEGWLTEFSAALRRAYEENPAARFASAEELGHVLRVAWHRLKSETHPLSG